MNRIEDGFWDPDDRDRFYFVTTEGGDTTPLNPGDPARDGGGLWRLEFNDVDRPLLGGKLTLLLDGTEAIGPGEPGMNKPDNMTIDDRGNVLIQEDPGNNRTSRGSSPTGSRTAPSASSPGLREPVQRRGSAFMTEDEESSGIIDAERAFGRGSFLFDAQIHTADGLPAGHGPGTVQEYVEHGQLLLLQVRDLDDVYGDSDDDDDD